MSLEITNKVADWTGFFQAEVGAAAALAGLLFVSVSVNQQRILALGRMADRGLCGLIILLLSLLASSLPLIPGQSIRLLGGETLVLSIAALGVIVPLQRRYLRHVEPEYRSRMRRTILNDRLSVIAIFAAGAMLVWRGDVAGLYVMAAGVLLCFIAGGANAWVLLIEINR
jgi:modulator of FtsH protease